MQLTRCALITGATGGIGEALCREFASHGHNLVITARNKQRLLDVAERLKSAYQVEVLTIPADLNQPDAAKNLFRELREGRMEIDFLINNAGFGLGGAFFHNKLKTQEAMIRVNAIATTKLCRMFLPGLIGRGGKIMNVASTGAFSGGPYNAVYCATKAYVLSLTEALDCELRGSGVSVSALCPGAVRTGFAHRANMESTRLFHYGVMKPRDVARAAYRGMMRGEKLIIPGCLNKILVLTTRFLPRCVSARASGFIQRQFTC